MPTKNSTNAAPRICRPVRRNGGGFISSPSPSSGRAGVGPCSEALRVEEDPTLTLPEDGEGIVRFAARTDDAAPGVLPFRSLAGHFRSQPRERP